jgi:hypothetical protein
MAGPAAIARKAKGGSKPGERRGGRQQGTPNKLTVVTKAIVAAAMSDPNAKALDIIQTLYRQPDLDENLRVKYLLGAVKFESPPIAAVPPSYPGDSAKLIDATTSETDRARLDRLSQLDRKAVLHMDDLTAAEETELAHLHAWSDTLPPHLLDLTPDDLELRRLLKDEPGLGRMPHYEPDEYRRHIEAKRRAPVEVRSTTPEPPEDGEVPPPMDDDDDGLG